MRCVFKIYMCQAMASSMTGHYLQSETHVLSNSQFREPGLLLPFRIFFFFSFTPLCYSSLSCINESLSSDRGGYVNSLCDVITMWLSASQRSRGGVGMNGLPGGEV